MIQSNVKPAICHPNKKMYCKDLCRTCYNRESDRRNPVTAKDRQVRSARKYRAKPESRQKAKEYNKAYYATNGSRYRALNKKWRQTHREHQMVIQARKRAKEKGWECTITHEDIKIPEYCPVLGVKLQVGSNVRLPESPSIDRIDSSKGYTPDNIAVISEKANRIKNDANLSDILLIADYMLKHAKIGTVNA